MMVLLRARFMVGLYLVSFGGGLEVGIVQRQRTVIKHLNLRDNIGQTLILVINSNQV